jgi:xanthine dehydrogenase YagS FAD-binding subunit
MRNFEYAGAPSTDRAIELLGGAADDPDARPRIIAGGTDLLHEMKEGLIAPARLVNIKENESLKSVRFDRDEGLRIGALVTLAGLQADATVSASYPAVAAAVRLIASPQIRNVATVGGNLCQRPRCWYYRDRHLRCARKGGAICFAYDGENAYHAIFGGRGCVAVHPSDLAPALIAHGARIACAGPEGRRTLPLDEFFVGPEIDIRRENVLASNEMVEEVALPAPAAGTRGVYLKVRDRGAWDFATVSVAAVLEMEAGICRRASVVLGAVAPVPWPARGAEAALEGARIDAGTARRAGEAAVAGAEPLAQNGYKAALARALVRRAVLQAAGGG